MPKPNPIETAIIENRAEHGEPETKWTLENGSEDIGTKEGYFCADCMSTYGVKKCRCGHPNWVKEDTTTPPRENETCPHCELECFEEFMAEGNYEKIPSLAEIDDHNFDEAGRNDDIGLHSHNLRGPCPHCAAPLRINFTTNDNAIVQNSIDIWIEEE